VQGRIKGKKQASAFLWADEVVGEGSRVSKGSWREKRRDKVEGSDGVRSDEVRSGGERSDEEQEQEEEVEIKEEAAFMEWYQERKWTRDRMMRAMQRYGREFIGQGLNISGWRQMVIGISNKYFNKALAPGTEEDEGEDEEGEGGLVDSIYDLQAGHGSHVAGMIYAREFGQGNIGTLKQRDGFRKISIQWHRFLGFGARDRLLAGRGGAKRVRGLFEVEREDIQRRRFEQLRHTDIRGQLKQMMGKDADFRGKQEEVIRAVMAGTWPIVQVAPTGGGKSLTFMLPAYCVPDGVTIVVTPLVALENDMVRRCTEAEIEGYVWKSNGLQRAASLIFVTPESAVTKAFRVLVERLQG
jgi:hypothetical protein